MGGGSKGEEEGEKEEGKREEAGRRRWGKGARRIHIFTAPTLSIIYMYILVCIYPYIFILPENRKSCHTCMIVG